MLLLRRLWSSSVNVKHVSLFYTLKKLTFNLRETNRITCNRRLPSFTTKLNKNLKLFAVKSYVGALQALPISELSDYKVTFCARRSLFCKRNIDRSQLNFLT